MVHSQFNSQIVVHPKKIVVTLPRSLRESLYSFLSDYLSDQVKREGPSWTTVSVEPRDGFSMHDAYQYVLGAVYAVVSPETYDQMWAHDIDTHVAKLKGLFEIHGPTFVLAEPMPKWHPTLLTEAQANTLRALEQMPSKQDDAYNGFVNEYEARRMRQQHFLENFNIEVVAEDLELVLRQWFAKKALQAAKELVNDLPSGYFSSAYYQLWQTALEAIRRYTFSSQKTNEGLAELKRMLGELELWHKRCKRLNESIAEEKTPAKEALAAFKQVANEVYAGESPYVVLPVEWANLTALVEGLRPQLRTLVDEFDSTEADRIYREILMLTPPEPKS